MFAKNRFFDTRFVKVPVFERGVLECGVRVLIFENTIRQTPRSNTYVRRRNHDVYSMKDV